MEQDLLVLELGSVSMGQDQVELVLDQEALYQEALDQVGLVLGQPLVVVMDQEALDREGLVLALPVVVVLDQVALDLVGMDQEEQGQVLVFILLVDHRWARINYPN